MPLSTDVVAFKGNEIPKMEVAVASRVDTPLVLPNKAGRPARREARKAAIYKAPKVYRMLNLFSGTGSVSETFRKMGYQTFSVDCDPKQNATTTVDSWSWQY